MERTTLSTLLTNYSSGYFFDVCLISSGDKFGVFFNLPVKSLSAEFREKCLGGKHSKLSITAGEKIPVFVIGKSKTLRCFKNVKSLPCRYRSQPKSWMDSNLF